MSDARDEDPIIEAAIERVLARYSAILPANKLEEMRRSLRFGASNHPGAQDLVRRLRPRVAMKRSGEMDTEGMQEAEETPRSGGER